MSAQPAPQPGMPGADGGWQPDLPGADGGWQPPRQPRTLPWLAGAALLGMLAVAGFAPLSWWPLVPPCLAGLFLVWRHAPLTRARSGLAFGVGLFSVGVHWIYISLHDHGGMPALLALLALLGFALLNALVIAASGALSALLSRGGRGSATADLLLAMPAAWTLHEWVRCWLLTGFPWLSVGYSQVPEGPLAGYAPLGGIYACSLALALCGGVLALAVERRQWRWLLLLLVIALPARLGGLPWTTPAGGRVSVTLLQGDVPQDDKFESAHIRQALHDYREMATATRSALVIMPETSLALFRDALPEGYLESLRVIGMRNGGNILAGLFDETRPGVYQNTVTNLGIDPPQVYRKHHLVPFGEFIPLKPLVQPLMDAVLDIPIADQGAAGPDQPPLHLVDQLVAVDICYEDAFGDEIIRALPAATLLVNVSNDAWFGSNVGPEQHLQIAQARALETGRPMARATNTGVTALIGADGRVLARADKGVRTALQGTLQGRSGATPYVRAGNLPVLLGCLLLALAALPGGWRRQSPSAGTGEPPDRLAG